MPGSDSLTIFFPMWNEESYIRATMGAARRVCEALVAEGELGGFELLIVDDASTDATGRIADELAESDARVRVVHHDTNRKLGGSIRTGLAHSSGDLVLYTDADLPCDIGELRKALRLLRDYDADVVSAYRHDRTGEGPRRAVYSFAYNWLVRAALRIYVRDVNFAFKLFRRDALNRLELRSEGSFIDAEILTRADRLGMRTIQFGVDYFPRSRGVSTLSSNDVIVKILREMWALRGELRALSESFGPNRLDQHRGGSAPPIAPPQIARPHSGTKRHGGRGRPHGSPPGERLLIVNADDYGLTEGISLGIVRAHREGVVTSTSVLAVGPAFERTVRWLQDAPDIGVGAHLAAVGEDPPLLSSGEIPTLLDSRGRFLTSWRAFAARAAARRIDPEQLTLEFEAQLERLRGAGIAITHLDTHQHLHLLPVVRDVVLGIACRHGIGAIRVPRSRAARPASYAVRVLSRTLAARATSVGVAFPADGVGLDEAGRLDSPTLGRTLASIAARASASCELVTHPGEPEDADRGAYRWGYRWSDELAALTSPEARESIKSLGFVPATYCDLP